VTLIRRMTTARPRAAVLAVGAVGYGVLVSFTHLFTAAADVATACPLVVAVVLVGATWRSHGPATATGGLPVARRGSLVWVSVFVILAAWELYCYANQPRVMHPTFSSLIDLLDRTHVGKTAAVVVWLALGWFLAVP
jgi:hypothetical protein